MCDVCVLCQTFWENFGKKKYIRWSWFDTNVWTETLNNLKSQIWNNILDLFIIFQALQYSHIQILQSAAFETQTSTYN